LRKITELKTINQKITMFLLVSGLVMLSGLISSACAKQNQLTVTPTETTIDKATAEGIFAGMKNAFVNMNTYQYEMEAKNRTITETKYTNVTDSFDLTFGQKNKVIIDTNKSDARGEFASYFISGTKNGVSENITWTDSTQVIFFKNGDCYRPMGETGGYTKFTDTAEADQIFGLMDEISFQSYLSENSTLISVNKVDYQGSLCYLVELKPDITRFLEYTSWKGMRDGGNFNKLRDGVKTAVIRYQITQENLSLAQAYLYLETGTDEARMSYYSFEENISFHKVNEPANIDFPADITGK
jgi:hypothetical protein